MRYDFNTYSFADVGVSPDRSAITHAQGAISWRALHARTQLWMERARAAGARPDYPMVILGHKEPSFISAILGCLSMGVPYVPIDTLNPEERIRYIVEVAHASVIFDAAANRFIQGQVEAIPLEAPEIAYIMFTSGSTGAPKGVQIGRESVSLFAGWIRDCLNLGAAPIVMDQMLFSFDFSLFNLVAALDNGGTCALCARDVIADREGFLAYLSATRVNVWASTPSFVRQQLMNPDFNGVQLPDLRVFIFGAESLHRAMVEALHERFPGIRIINSYGPTEATCSTTWVEIDDAMRQSGEGPYSIGRAKPYANVVVIDGEICISGDHVMRGYLNRPDRNLSHLFIHNGKRAYRTGDLGFIDPDGLVHFRGRRDDQIKLNGYRIELAEIDMALASLPGVRAGVCAPLHRQDGSLLRLIGVVELSRAPEGEGLQTLPDALMPWRDILGKRLPSYMIPSELVAFAALPTTQTDKVDRKRVEAMYFESRQRVKQAS